MLVVQSLYKSYSDGEQIVDVIQDLSFSVPTGSSLAVTGPSGSGKSTLLNLLAGVLLPERGDIQLQRDGQGAGEISLISDPRAAVRTRLRRQSIGYVHQFFSLIPTLTVLENVVLPAQLNKLDDATERAMVLLRRVELENRAAAFPETLSGGQQQRVAVARALAADPVMVLADEPTGNLDRANAQRVSDLLFEVSRERAAILVVATHSDLVSARADQRLELYGTGV